jgi:hypothetical protein
LGFAPMPQDICAPSRLKKKKKRAGSSTSRPPRGGAGALPPHVFFLLLLPVRPSLRVSHEATIASRPASASAPPGSGSPAPPCLPSTRRPSPPSPSIALGHVLRLSRRPAPGVRIGQVSLRCVHRVFARFLPKSLGGGGCMGTGSALGGCRMMCAPSPVHAIPLQTIGSGEFILSSITESQCRCGSVIFSAATGPCGLPYVPSPTVRLQRRCAARKSRL